MAQNVLRIGLIHMQYTQQPTNTGLSTSPIPSFYAWGETLGIILVAIAILAKRFLKKEEAQEVKEEKSEEELIHFLKKEIDKRDELIAKLSNELILIRKVMEFSGETSPPVTKKRILEVNKNAAS